VDGSRVDVARSFVGIAIRAGAPRPDISTPEALKRTLLSAASVTFSDPATGAASGVHAVRLFERLGIAAEMKPKFKLGEGYVGPRVASGEAELAIQQISALKAVAGIEIVGPLPAELQYVTYLSAGLGAAAQAPDAAKSLLNYLASPEAAAVIKSKGLEPGSGS
jgi:molybdate transport system substrate-binding protein